MVIGIRHCSCCRLRVTCSSRDIHFCIPSEDESVAAGAKKRELLPHDFTRPFLGLHFFLSFSIITGDNPFCACGANSQFGDFPLRENKEEGGGVGGGGAGGGSVVGVAFTHLLLFLLLLCGGLSRHSPHLASCRQNMAAAESRDVTRLLPWRRR